jgi:hypothetical protein
MKKANHVDGVCHSGYFCFDHDAIHENVIGYDSCCVSVNVCVNANVSFDDSVYDFGYSYHGFDDHDCPFISV